MTTDLALAALARLRLERTASYSASLLVVGNWKQIAHSIVSPSDDCSRIPAPLACWLDKPFIHIIHVASLLSSSSFAVNWATKLAKA